MEALAEDVPTPVIDDLLVLVEAMREGKESALEALYDATVSKLYGLASVILRRGEDAEDVVCAPYAHAWANAARYDRRRSSVLGWLLMLCRSRALDVLRQRRAQNALLENVANEPVQDLSPEPDELLGLVKLLALFFTGGAQVAAGRTTNPLLASLPLTAANWVEQLLLEEMGR